MADKLKKENEGINEGLMSLKYNRWLWEAIKDFKQKK